MQLIVPVETSNQEGKSELIDALEKKTPMQEFPPAFLSTCIHFFKVDYSCLSILVDSKIIFGSNLERSGGTRHSVCGKQIFLVNKVVL